MWSATATATQITRSPPIMPPTIAPIFFDFFLVGGLRELVISGWPEAAIG
jgi:hypothetical protein